MIRFRTAYTLPADMPSPVGEPTYTWEYLTPDGEIVRESRNLYEMIQSSKNTTLYKEIIDNYGIDGELLGGRKDALYGDTTQFGGTVDDFGSRINALIADLEQALSAAESREEVQQVGVQSTQAPAQTATAGQQKEGVKAHA